MENKIAIVGPGASGKDVFRKRMQNKGFKFGVSCTTRPPRPGEVQGKDYYFITNDDFEDLIETDSLVEWRAFKDWKYGITKAEFEECDVMILNAEAVNRLPNKYRKQLFIIYIDAPEEVRRERLKARSDSNDSIERRIQVDREQFRNFSDFDCKITNPDF